MTVDYDYLCEVLSSAIQAAMWSNDFGEQVNELSALQDALEHRGKDLPLPDAARLRLDVLAVLKSADTFADDPRAKEFGTLYCLLDNLSEDERGRLAALLVQLLRFTSARSDSDAGG